MDWPRRLQVALGAAKGLAYLHSSSDVGIPIVHRDFKSTNILLDDSFEAKVNRLPIVTSTFHSHNQMYKNKINIFCRYLILVSPS